MAIEKRRQRPPGCQHTERKRRGGQRIAFPGVDQMTDSHQCHRDKHPDDQERLVTPDVCEGNDREPVIRHQVEPTYALQRDRRQGRRHTGEGDQGKREHQ